MLTTDRVAGAALVMLSLAVLVESRRLPLGSLRNPGPAYLPVALAIVLVCLGALLVVFGGKAPALACVGWTEWRHAVAIFLVCAFSALALERIGFRLTIALALAFAAGAFLLFDTLLRVPLPRGPLGL